MLTPATSDLTLYIGGTFDPLIELWQDDAQTIEFDLTGYTVLFVIRDKFSLSSGSGLTVTAATGKVQVLLTDVQSATLSEGPVEWRLSIEDGSGNVEFPVAGTIQARYS